MKVKDYNVYLDELTSLSASHSEPNWMLDLRKTALNALNELDLPVIERVKVKRMGLTKVDMTEYQLEEGNVFDFENTGDTPLLVQQETVTLIEQMPASLIEKGVIFTDIFTAMEEHADLVQEAYMQLAVKYDEDKLTAFNAAFMNSGVFLYIPKNVVIEDPIEALFIQDLSAKGTFVKHVLIVAEENSEITYLERYKTIGEPSDDQIRSGNIIVEVITKPGARVKFSAIDQMGENIVTYLNRRGHLLKDSTIQWAMALLNDGDIITDFDSDLVGMGSHADVKVVGISTGSQLQGVDTRVTNMAPHSIGHILQHGVILDKSTLTFNGIGHILKGATGADAQQESRVLMLSDEARGDANPILLIDHNDVTAGHAASVGRLDPEELYYLMSRGLPKKEAERLVTRGFLGAVITAIPVKSVQKEFVQEIERKLAD